MVVRHGQVCWDEALCGGTALSGMVRCGLFCGMVWSGVVRCGLVWWYSMIRCGEI